MSRPILIRPNSTFDCHGDGTCCTTIHLLGPLTKDEARFVKSKAHIVLPNTRLKVVTTHEGSNDLALATNDHRCVFQDTDARCRYQEVLGHNAKPSVCRHFPLSATKTPHGIRIALSHRCPCVSLSTGPALNEERANAILTSANKNKISCSIKIGNTVAWRDGKEISFNDYVLWENTLLEQLDGTDPLPALSNVLGMDYPEQLPTLHRKNWNTVSKRMLDWLNDAEEDDGFFCAVRWAALELRDERSPWTPPLRPWDWTFRRSSARLREQMSPRRIFGSWLADYFWSMMWCADGTAYEAKASASARYALAARLTKRLHSTGTREDLAAAEAIMIVDIVTASEPWLWVLKHIVESP